MKASSYKVAIERFAKLEGLLGTEDFEDMILRLLEARYKTYGEHFGRESCLGLHCYKAAVSLERARAAIDKCNALCERGKQ